MLHKINIPNCRQKLEWIVSLQKHLLVALCQNNVTAQNINLDWVVSSLASFNIEKKWIKRFYNRKIPNGEVKCLDLMKKIAGLQPAQKQELVDSFNNDQLFYLAFDENDPQIHPLKGISGFGDEAKKNITALFEYFYNPWFYKDLGYNTPHDNKNKFYRQEFINSFRNDNPLIEVCPMCDNNLDDTEIDHFYPKSVFPFLSCHPLNLVPICSGCNGSDRKSGKSPLTLDSSDPVLDWFHPYLRPLAFTDSINYFTSLGNINITWNTVNNKLKPILSSSNAQTQIRINNLDSLIKLSDRWQQLLSGKSKSIFGRVANKKKRSPREITDKNQLIAYLQNEAENAKFDIGLEAHAILDYHFLLYIADENTPIFEELWLCLTSDEPLPLNEID